jgi:hypothetical protein
MSDSKIPIFVLHIESGLGNQMLSYCELLALRKTNPDADIYIETILYDIPECNKIICQWNGYELGSIFGIKEKNVQELFNDEIWQNVKKDLQESRFWAKNWNYAPYIVKSFNKYGLKLKNTLPDREDNKRGGILQFGLIGRLRFWFMDHTLMGSTIKRVLKSSAKIEERNRIWQKILFEKTDSDIFAGQRLLFKLCGTGLERIETEVRHAFTFLHFVMNETNI